MPATAALLEVLEDSVDTVITHIGLVDETDTELAGGSPAYARQAVTFVDGGAGIIRPSVNLDFDIPAGDTVAGWRGYSALTVGTDYGGQDLSPEAYISQGVYTLLASQTGVVIT